jgi:hypothetical protein
MNWISEDGKWETRTFVFPFDDPAIILNDLAGRTVDNILVKINIPRSYIIDKTHQSEFIALYEQLMELPNFTGLCIEELADNKALDFQVWADSVAMEIFVGKQHLGKKFTGFWIADVPNLVAPKDRVIIVDSDNDNTILDGVAYALTSEKTRVASPSTLIIMGESRVRVAGMEIISAGIDDIIGPVPVKYKAKTTANVNFRTEPRVADDTRIETLPTGTTVWVLDRELDNGYLKVEYGDVIGFLYNSYVEYVL